MITSGSDIALGALIGAGFGFSLQTFLTTIAKVPEGLLRWSLGKMHSSWRGHSAGSAATGSILGFVLWGALLLTVVFACEPLVVAWPIYARSVLWALIGAVFLRQLLQLRRLRRRRPS